MSGSDTLGALVQAYVETQCGVLLEARAAIIARDEDLVHPARVAIRRLRATLRSFGAVYDADDRSDFADELRWAANLLGDVRDLQVLAERFGTEDAAAAPDAHRVIAEEIERNRAEAWSRVVDALGSGRGTTLFETVARWRDDPPFTPKAERPADRARRRVDKADARVDRRLARARAASDAGSTDTRELLHDARKAAKRHRYAVELAQPVLGAKAERTIERRQALQDALGEHQDAVVALAFLQRIEVGAQDREAASVVLELIARARASADDVAGVLRETERLRD
ncbi:MAG TPA: CHAD domain-containing protein [Microbacterium sp.]|nr:CHAD domain-containing protein [Microbacterium sp.]